MAAASQHNKPYQAKTLLKANPANAANEPASFGQLSCPTQPSQIEWSNLISIANLNRQSQPAVSTSQPSQLTSPNQPGQLKLDLFHPCVIHLCKQTLKHTVYIFIIPYKPTVHQYLIPLIFRVPVVILTLVYLTYSDQQTPA